MWIFISIVAFLALLIFVILMLPVYLIIKTDEKGEIIVRYKILNKVYGEDPDPDQPILKLLKNSVGVTRIEKVNSDKEKQTGIDTLTNLVESFSLIVGLLKRLLQLLKFGTIKKLKLNIVCGDEDAAQTAIDYGICYSIVSPLVGLVHSLIKVKRKGEKINITCDYSSTETTYDVDIVLLVRFFRVLIAVIRASYDEYKRHPEAYTKTNQKNKKA